jgi:hypothetical protein
MMRAYWVSCAKFTVRVAADEDGVITEAAPIVRRFIGQPLGNLTRWAAGLGGLGGVRTEVLIFWENEINEQGRDEDGRTADD